VIALVIMVGAVVGLSLLVASGTGRLGVPQNDAWSYSKVALTLARTGHSHMGCPYYGHPDCA